MDMAGTQEMHKKDCSSASISGEYVPATGCSVGWSAGVVVVVVLVVVHGAWCMVHGHG